jgi:hypothetical protein
MPVGCEAEAPVRIAFDGRADAVDRASGAVVAAAWDRSAIGSPDGAPAGLGRDALSEVFCAVPSTLDRPSQARPP